MPPRSALSKLIANTCGVLRPLPVDSNPGQQQFHQAIEVTRILRKMYANGSTYLTTARDGGMYAMTTPTLDRSDLSLFNEAYGYNLGDCLQLPFSTWCPLIVDCRTEHCEQTQSSISGRHGTVLNGLYFGSKLRSTQAVVIEYLASSLMARENVALQMARMRVFDSWISLGGPRFYLAYHDRESDKVDIVFSRNASMLSYDPRRKAAELHLKNPYIKTVNSQLLTEAVDTLIDIILNLDRVVLERLAETVPSGWSTSGERRRVVDALFRRRTEIAMKRHSWKTQAEAKASKGSPKLV